MNLLWGGALATWHSWLLGELRPKKWRRTNIERSHHWLNIPNRNPARALTGSRFIPSNLSKFKTWISQEATIEVQFDYITQLCTSHDHVQVDYRTLNNVCFRLFFVLILFWFNPFHLLFFPCIFNSLLPSQTCSTSHINRVLEGSCARPILTPWRS